MLSDVQLDNLKNNIVTPELLTENGLGSAYYLEPLNFIQNKLKLLLTCTGQEYKEAVEMANDEDIAPEDKNIEVIVDGVLAMIYSDYITAVGLNLITYFTYRFNPPNMEFQRRLDKFEELVNKHKVHL